MNEMQPIKHLVVVKNGISYKFKGVSLQDSNASTILDIWLKIYLTKNQ